jgi:hypothetical protein
VPILGIFASAISGHLTPADLGSYFPLGEFTLSAAQANVEFTNIPQEYDDLQILALARTSRGTYGVDSLRFQFNGDTTNSYSWHHIRGDGSSIESSAGTNLAYMEAQRILGTSTGGSYGAFVMDIEDYRNSNKYKTVLTMGGVDVNGTVGGIGGASVVASGNWRSFNPITSIKLYGDAANFTSDSYFALYGVKS